MKTYIGIVTFGNLPFTKLAYQSILETVESQYEVCIVVGKPGDEATIEWAKSINLPYMIHSINLGFPASINDLYDWGFGAREYDAYVAMGNDVVAYPYAIDNMIKVAETTNYEWICAREVSVKSLCKHYPEVQSYFSGNNFIFNDFTSKPWEVFKDYGLNVTFEEGGLSDVHNLALYTKSAIDKLGYVDVNFYPAYYEDNDYARRGILTNVKSTTLENTYYFHFWSRTIKQESGGSTGGQFRNNKKYYIDKWGGDFGSEKFDIPFNGEPYLLGGVQMPSTVKIYVREYEQAAINYWRSR
jgi:GT2 family glycosyltransferase